MSGPSVSIRTSTLTGLCRPIPISILSWRSLSYSKSISVLGKWPKNRLSSNIAHSLTSGRNADYSAKCSAFHAR
jgi:hypothetical protein